MCLNKLKEWTVCHKTLRIIDFTTGGVVIRDQNSFIYGIAVLSYMKIYLERWVNIGFDGRLYDGDQPS
jgi:hypothetical protein